MRLGLSSVVLSRAPASEKTPEAVARHCRGLGLLAVELRPDYLEEQTMAPSTVGRILRSRGLDLVYATGTLLADCPYQPEDPHNPLRLDFAVVRLLDAEMLRIFPGDLTRGGAESSMAARSWSAFAASEGRRLVLENTGAGPGSDPVDLGQFLRDTHANISLNFDVGNAARAGFEPAASLAKVLDVTAMLHLKDFSPRGSEGTDAAPGDGSVNFAAVARVLAGWSGLACLEVNAGSEPWIALEAWVRWLYSIGF